MVIRLNKRIKDNGYKLGKIWLPHDARAKTFAAKHSAIEIFLMHFGVEKTGIVPDSSKADRINAAWAYLMPILEENGGWAIFNGTPRGRNHAYRSVIGAIKNPNSFGEILSAEDTHVFTSQQLETIKEKLIETYGEATLSTKAVSVV